MDIHTIDKILQANTIPAINRICGSNIVGFDLKSTKMKIIKEEAEARAVQICESVIEEIETLYEKINPFNDEQKEFIQLLESYEILSRPLPVEVQTEKLSPLINIVEESEQSTVINENKSEVGGDDINLEVLTEKIDMCPNFESLYALEEEFNNVGLTIQRTPEKITLCKIENNKPKVDKIFEDHMPIDNDPKQEISNRFSECIIKFIRKAASPT